ncbi:MAG: YciI family protein [Pseudomonadota bacterium]
MKVMVFVKATADSEAGAMPTAELLNDMMAYNEELMKAGIIKGGDGLQPSSKGVRIRFSGKNRTVTAGPFAETNELVAGYWLWEVKDMDEAIAWAKRCPNPMFSDSDLELRPIIGPEFFADLMTHELQATYDEMQKKV